MNELQIQEQLQPLQVRVGDLVQSAMTLTVDSSESQQAAVNLRELLKKELAGVEAKEKEFTKPLNDTLRKLRDVFRPVKDTISNALLHIQTESSTYYVNQKRLEAELQAKEDKLAARRKSPLPVPVSRHVEVAQKVVDGTSFIDHWDAEVTDLSSIPLFWNDIQLLTPITSTLNRLGNESKGKAVIPGVKFNFTPYQRSGR
jgi:hypothetical protein